MHPSSATRRRWAAILVAAALLGAGCGSSGTDIAEETAVVPPAATEQPVATTAPLQVEEEPAPTATAEADEPVESEDLVEDEAASDAPAETEDDAAVAEEPEQAQDDAAAAEEPEQAEDNTAADEPETEDGAADGSQEADEETTAGSTDAAASTPASGATDTTAGVLAAAWSSNVQVTLGDGMWTFRSDSIPAHELPDQYLIPSGAPGDGNPSFVPTNTDTLIPAVELVHQITLNPVYAEVPTDIPLGQGAVIISGAELYNDFEDMQRSVVALDDQTLIDGIGFLDACNGHPLASGLSYHYHGIPYCVSDAVDVSGQHSSVIGFMLDGFPVYANKDVGGAVITSASLDECNGHVGPTPEFPDGIYHYHLTDDAAPYSINCYHGEIEVRNTGPGGGGGGGGGERPDGPPPGDGERPERPEGPPPGGEGRPPEEG